MAFDKREIKREVSEFLAKDLEPGGKMYQRLMENFRCLGADEKVEATIREIRIRVEGSTRH